MKYFVRLTACLIVIAAFADTSAAQKRMVSSTPACSFPGYNFACPRGLKMIARDETKKTFLARRIEKDYTFGVFVLDSGATSNIEETIEKEFLPKFFSSLKKELRSKQAESMSTDPMSDFEVDRKLRVVFDGSSLVSYVYREFKQGERQFYAGTVWQEKMSPSEAAEMFREVTRSTEGGCDNVLTIVRSITKEKIMSDSDDKHPCRVEIIMEAPPAENK